MDGNVEKGHPWRTYFNQDEDVPKIGQVKSISNEKIDARAGILTPDERKGWMSRISAYLSEAYLCKNIYLLISDRWIDK